MAQNPDDHKFLELWKDATRKYEEDTKIKFATHALAGCNNPDAVLDALDRDLQEFKDYRDKKERFRKWLKPMLHLIGSLSETAGEAAGVPVPFARAGFVALGVLVQAAKNVSARFDSIIDLCELLHSFLERLRVYMSAQLPNNMREVVIRILTHLLSVFALMTKEIKHNRFGEVAVGYKRSYLRTLIGRTDVQDALKKLNDLIGAEQSMGVANAMVFSREILDHLHGLVLDANEHIMKYLGNLNRRHLDDSVRSWLKAPDARTNHNTARSLHDGSTGNWLVRSFEYRSWKSTLSSFFWINGKPGAGKTIICSTVIEDMLALSGGVHAYFYFYYSEADKQSLRGMLSSIISQLEEQLLDAPSPLLALYQKLGSGAHEPSIPELTACLKSLIIALSARPIFIILDALDECSKTDELAPVLCDLLQWAEGCVHVFVTSRPEDAVVKLLRPLTTCDISLYLGHIMSKEHPFCSWPQVHRDRVLNHLLEHSNGMFRWVSCQLDDLRKCLLRDLQVTLNNLPTTLDATYERILSRIHTTNKPHARRLFNWIAFSFRPLHVEELAQVLAINFIDDASATFEEEYIEPDPREAISRVCLSLVHITPDGTVQFAHFSVKEFFMSERIQSMLSVSLFRIEAEMAHTIIATSCLAYVLWVGSMDNIPYNMKEIEVQYPLADYSVQYAVHAQFSCVSDNVRDMLGSLFIQDSCQWTFWVFHNYESLMRDYTAGPPLYWAAKLGFLQILLLLLEHGADVNAQGGYYGNALKAASAEGYLDLAQLLLEHGADVNAQGGHYGNALQVVSLKGRLDLAQLLLERGADVNAQGGEYKNALYAASSKGHLDLTRLLLEHGADVNAQKWEDSALDAAVNGDHLDLAWLLLEHGADVNVKGGSHESALQVVSSRGHLDFAQLLLECGAYVNAQGGHYGNALQAASICGHLDVAQLLLEHGADVNAQGPDINMQGGHYRNALQAASIGCHLDLARLLLEHGADANAQGGPYGNALQAVSSGGHLDLKDPQVERGAATEAERGWYRNALQGVSSGVHLDLAKLLLEHGADVNAQGGHYGNALQAALTEGHLDLARLLLEHGADVNTQDGLHGNALQAASSRGHLDFAQLLLECGAYVNAQGGHYGNALQAASAGGHLGLAQLLLERGADVNAQGGYYGNALQAASANGYLGLAQLLLERGADVNAQGGYYGNALQAASANDHLDLAQLLLEHGADVNAQGGHFGNALQAASSGGHLDLAQLLLEHGADINAQGGCFGNALQAASLKGRLDLAQLLLERGADVNAQGGHYGNALQAASLEGCLDLAQLLLKRGADVNAQSGWRLLLEHGANVNAQGGYYENALQAASAEGHLDLAQLLLEHGADVNAQGGHFGNALQAAPHSVESMWRGWGLGLRNTKRRQFVDEFGLRRWRRMLRYGYSTNPNGIGKYRKSRGVVIVMNAA
ncbi:ankyrin repeat-containing domain protein [Mycena olivaceomarginata]|nr:ankyrin repeat-containing domain protein [Mycena olivaceomarginata]